MVLYFLNSIEPIKEKIEKTESPLFIDVDSWLYSNGIIYEDMNSVREYIFIEWVHKKINAHTLKKSSDSPIYIIFSRTDLKFIDNMVNNLECLNGSSSIDPVYIQ